MTEKIEIFAEKIIKKTLTKLFRNCPNRCQRVSKANCKKPAKFQTAVSICQFLCAGMPLYIFSEKRMISIRRCLRFLHPRPRSLEEFSTACCIFLSLGWMRHTTRPLRTSLLFVYPFSQIQIKSCSKVILVVQHKICIILCVWSSTNGEIVHFEYGQVVFCQLMRLLSTNILVH